MGNPNKQGENRRRRRHFRRRISSSITSTFKADTVRGRLKSWKSWKPFSAESKRDEGTAFASWLWIKTEQDTWRKCWFILDGTSLSHYESNKQYEGSNEGVLNVGVDSLAEGNRFIVDLNRIESALLGQNWRTIEITLKDGGGALLIRARTRKMAKEWLEKLQQVLQSIAEDEIRQFEDQMRCQYSSSTEFSYDAESSDEDDDDDDNTSLSSFDPDDYSLYVSRSSRSFRSLKAALTTSINEKKEIKMENQTTSQTLEPQGPFSEECRKHSDVLNLDESRNSEILNPVVDKSHIVPSNYNFQEIRVSHVSQLNSANERQHTRDGIVPTTTLKSRSFDTYSRLKSGDTKILLRDTLQLVSSLLKKVLAMDGQKEEIVTELVDNMHKIEVRKGQYLIKEGEVNEEFFVIASGKFNIMKSNGNFSGQIFIDEMKNQQRIVATKGRGAFLGEVSLLHDIPSSVSIRCLQNGTVWSLPRYIFEEIRGKQQEFIEEQKFSFLDSISVVDFSKGSDKDLASLVNVLQYKNLGQNELIASPEKQLSKVIFVVSGVVKVLGPNDEEIKSVRKGQCFGEHILLKKHISECKLVVGTTMDEEKTAIVYLDVEKFENEVGPLTEYLSEKFLFRQTKNIAGDGLGSVTPGKLGRSGRNQDSRRSFQATLKVYKKEESQSQLDLDERIIKSFQETERSPYFGNVRTRMSVARTKERAIPWPECPPLMKKCAFEKLIPKYKLGAGSFGTVYLVKLDDGGEVEESPYYHASKFMALKKVSRSSLTHPKHKTLVENEICCMKELSFHENSPFLVAIYHSYVHKEDVFLLLELCEGGDLYDRLQAQPTDSGLPLNEVQFYLACVLSGMETIHKHNIIFRDLKPENIMIAGDGYAKIADFGFAKKAFRTYTICGTAEYMAPETILSHGQTEGVDIWAFGVLMYELTHGKVPFLCSSSRNTYETILDYANGLFNIEFNSPDVIGESKEMVLNLLQPATIKRYYKFGEGIGSYRDSLFFSDFGWHELESCLVAAPFIPVPREAIYEDLPTISFDVPEAHPQIVETPWHPPVDTIIE